MCTVIYTKFSILQRTGGQAPIQTPARDKVLSDVRATPLLRYMYCSKREQLIHDYTPLLDQTPCIQAIAPFQLAG